MASIDWGMIGLGALVGVGCRKQLKAAGRIAASTAASLAATAATAAQQVADETKSQKAPEEVAAEQKLKEIDEKMRQMMQDLYGQAGQGQNGH